MARASYKTAIAWIVENDDTEWLDGEADTADGTESVTAALVADLFEKTGEQVRKDLLRYRNKQGRTS